MGWWWTAHRTEMKAIWQGIVRTLFWSHERGSWPYDVMVVAIVAFVLLTPRTWFHDRSQSAAAVTAEVQLVAQDSDGTLTYRIDSKILPADKRTPHLTPELEREIHQALGRAVGDLKGRMFQVREVDPERAEDGSVVAYLVKVRI
jgi:hypothetical protein